jgi:hypothetical protein
VLLCHQIATSPKSPQLLLKKIGNRDNPASGAAGLVFSIKNRLFYFQLKPLNFCLKTRKTNKNETISAENIQNCIGFFVEPNRHDHRFFVEPVPIWLCQKEPGQTRIQIVGGGMNPSTIRSKLNSLGISSDQYDFGWAHCIPVIWIGDLVLPLPVNDVKDDAFAEIVAYVINNPQKYTTIDIMRRLK